MDLGVSAFSTGEPPVPGPKPHKMLLKRLQRLSKGLSRKQKGSRNRQKAKSKLAKLHAKISYIRKDALHKLTSDLTRRFDTIAIEDLNVLGMMSNRYLAKQRWQKYLQFFFPRRAQSPYMQPCLCFIL